jgi:hypothetical protein
MNIEATTTNKTTSSSNDQKEFQDIDRDRDTDTDIDPTRLLTNWSALNTLIRAGEGVSTKNLKTYCNRFTVTPKVVNKSRGKYSKKDTNNDINKDINNDINKDDDDDDKFDPKLIDEMVSLADRCVLELREKHMYIVKEFSQDKGTSKVNSNSDRTNDGNGATSGR